MNREQLREKILEHSNSMFPLIDFFNDIGRNKDPRYDKERAYKDIEKIYDVFMYYREKSEKLEKENQELKEKVKILKELNDINKKFADLATKAVQENTKLKKALDKACEKLDGTCPIEEELVEDLDCDYCDSNCKECWKKYFMKEELRKDEIEGED